MSSGFDLRIFTASGAEHAFQHDDADVARKNAMWLEPRALFDKQTLEIAGEHHITVLRTAEIARIELTMDPLPDWPMGPRIHSSELVEEAEFQRILAARADMQRESRVMVDGQEVEGAVELEDVAGQRFFLHLQGEAMPQEIRAGILRKVLEGPVLSARRGPTAVLFRTAHLSAMTAYPGVPELTYDAVIAHRLRRT